MTPTATILRKPGQHTDTVTLSSCLLSQGTLVDPCPEIRLEISGPSWENEAVEYLCSVHKDGFNPQGRIKRSTMAHPCNPSTQRVEAGGSEL